jgi:hypothetical protein
VLFRSEGGVDKMIDFRELLFVGLVLALFLLPSFVLGDPRGGSNELEVQGAHVVSAGAYFRFLVVNHYSFPIYVSIVNGGGPVYGFGYLGNFSLSVNITESIYVLPNSSGSFDVIAPEVSFPCEKVTYTFIQALALPVSQHALYLMDYQVIVLNSGLVQVLSTSLDPSFQYIIIGIGLTLVVISLIMWQRKMRRGIRGHGRLIRLLSDILLLSACCLFLISVVEPFLTSSRLTWGQPVGTRVNVDYWSYKASVMSDHETHIFSDYWFAYYDYIPIFMTRIPTFLIGLLMIQILTIAVGVLSLGLRKGWIRLVPFVSSATVILLMFFIHNELEKYAIINYEVGYWLVYPSMLLFLLAFMMNSLTGKRRTTDGKELGQLDTAKTNTLFLRSQNMNFVEKLLGSP